MLTKVEKSTINDALWSDQTDWYMMHDLWNGFDLKEKKEICMNYISNTPEHPGFLRNTNKKPKGKEYSDWVDHSSNVIIETFKRAILVPAINKKLRGWRCPTDDKYSTLGKDTHGYIFTYLTLGEVMGNMALVSYWWNTVANGNGSKHEISYSNALFKDIAKGKVHSHKAYNFTQIRLNNYMGGRWNMYHRYNDVRKISQRCRGLCLDYGDRQCVTYLTPFINKCEKIHKIELNNISFWGKEDGKMEPFVKPFKQFKDINSLSITKDSILNNSLSDTAGIHNLLDYFIFKSNKWVLTLKELKVSLINDDKWQDNHLMYRLQQLANLETLKIDLAVPLEWAPKHKNGLDEIMKHLKYVSIYWYYRDRCWFNGYFKTEAQQIKNDKLEKTTKTLINFWHEFTQMTPNLIELETNTIFFSSLEDMSGAALQFFEILSNTDITTLAIKEMRMQYILQLLSHKLMSKILKLTVECFNRCPNTLLREMYKSSKSLMSVIQDCVQLKYFS